jgi:hypothetical protein
MMFEQLANRFNATGVLACVVPPNNDGVCFTAVRILTPGVLQSESNSIVEINNIRFPVECWSRAELEEFSSVLPDDDRDILLSDRSEIIHDNDSFVFHNNPEILFGGCNPMFIRHESNSAPDVAEIIWNYYFGSPLCLNDEWTVPINYFPPWDARIIKPAFESCHTVGLKSWLSVERETEMRFRQFPSNLDESRQLMIREDGAECYILDRTKNEWLAWAKQKGLKFH